MPYLTTLFYVYLQSDTEVHIHWKGAAELLLASCRSWLSTDGSVQPMTSIKVNMHPTCLFSHSDFQSIINFEVFFSA
jgi:hypothetical protein